MRSACAWDPAPPCIAELGCWQTPAARGHRNLHSASLSSLHHINVAACLLTLPRYHHLVGSTLNVVQQALHQLQGFEWQLQGQESLMATVPDYGYFCGRKNIFPGEGKV